MPRWSSLAAIPFLVGVVLAQPEVVVKRPAADGEVHVVCVYEGHTKTGDRPQSGKAAVKVDRPGQAVTLVVSAYNPVTWEVTVAEGTALKKVVAAGYHRQAVTGLPPGLEVIEAFHEKREGKPYLDAYYRLDSGRLRPSVQAVHKWTGLEVSSYQGVYTAKADAPFVVDAVMKDERLSSGFPKVTAADALPKFRVSAARLIPDGHDFLASFGEFTEAGPDAASLKPLPAGVRQVVSDPAGKKHYGVTAHDVNEIDLARGKAAKLDPGRGVPKIQSVRALAFDAKRGRLLVVAGPRTLFQHTPASGEWGGGGGTPPRGRDRRAGPPRERGRAVRAGVVRRG